MLTLAILVGLLPAFVWLIFYLKEDTQAEPWIAVVVTFVAGIGSAILALGLQYLTRGHIGDGFALSGSMTWVAIAASIEEISKFVVVFFFIRWSRYLDEPIDALIYPIIAALGFATLENVAVAYTLISNADVASAFQVITLRFFGATLIHTVAAATVGWWWAKTLLKYSVS